MKDYPFKSLIRSQEVSKWRKINRLIALLNDGIKRKEEIYDQLFGLKILLDEQYFKWFIIASNPNVHNAKVEGKIKGLASRLKSEVANKSMNHLAINQFWRQNYIKIILQVINLDFFIYGDSLRTNLPRESTIHTVVEMTRRNLALSVINNAFLYAIPVFLILENYLFIGLLIISLYLQFHFAVRRTMKFYYLNEINRIIT